MTKNNKKEYKNFTDLSHDNIGNSYWMRGKVETIKQTSGPTLMILNDGSAHFTFKAFVKPGVRAYPEIEVGDSVEAWGQINLRNGGIEAEVSEMNKLSQEETEEFQKEITQKNKQRYPPKREDFSIESPAYEAMKKDFIDVATTIRKAVIEQRPIILRHDSDCDGYSSAICLERAIIALMDETSGDPSIKYQNYKRSPSKAPFYEYEDALKDISYWLRDKVKNGAKEPLIIITDNGSTEEDILGYKLVKLYNSEIVVIDHHYPGEKDEKGNVAVDYHIDGHVNPYLRGYDSNICSGMLGFEMAKFIYEKDLNNYMIPAMSALLDHVEGPEKQKYIEKAKEEGYSVEYMEQLGEVMYLQSHYLRFSEAREFVDDLFGATPGIQEEVVKILYPEVKKLYEKVKKIGKAYSTVEDYNTCYIVHFDGEKGTSRGQFPAVGKATNQIHKMFEEELDKPIITMTSGSTFLTIRVSDEIKGFSVPEFCSQWIDVKIPETGAEGGGHEHAGSIKFVEYARDDVIELFRQYLKYIAEKQNLN